MPSHDIVLFLNNVRVRRFHMVFRSNSFCNLDEVLCCAADMGVGIDFFYFDVYCDVFHTDAGFGFGFDVE